MKLVRTTYENRMGYSEMWKRLAAPAHMYFIHVFLSHWCAHFHDVLKPDMGHGNREQGKPSVQKRKREGPMRPKGNRQVQDGGAGYVTTMWVKCDVHMFPHVSHMFETYNSLHIHTAITPISQHKTQRGSPRKTPEITRNRHRKKLKGTKRTLKNIKKNSGNWNMAQEKQRFAKDPQAMFKENVIHSQSMNLFCRSLLLHFWTKGKWGRLPSATEHSAASAMQRTSRPWPRVGTVILWKAV